MRQVLLLSAIVFSLAGVGSPASATLLGQTVDPTFLLGNISGSSGTENEGTQTVTAAGAHYGQGFQDGSNIDVSASQIIITNDVPQPFCSSQNPCHDIFTGFDFKFSTGANIIGVTVDAASAAAFRPVAAGNPAGLVLTSANEFTVNLAGDAPAVGERLILDLTFGDAPVTAPEPGGVALLCSGLAGLLVLRRGQRRPRSSNWFLMAEYRARMAF